MISRSIKRKVSLGLCLICICSMFSGCANNQAKDEKAAVETVSVTAIPTAVPEYTAASDEASDFSTDELSSDVVNQTQKQKNAINMLNYLRALAQEIHSSSNSRLYLEECYSELLNNTHPNAVDQATLDEVMWLLDTLEECRMIAVKRERLQYIYEQNKAKAIRDAVPNPLGLLSAVGSFSLSKLAVSVVYMAVDSVTSYQSSSAVADLQYLQDGWQLDDEEAAALHNSRKQLFSYMVNMVNDYSLDGDFALNEDLVDEFVAWKNNENVSRRIQFFEANKALYQAFGPYWLTLAKSYYENRDYEKCLSAISSYEALDMQIFRNDYDYAQVLPMVIISADYTMEDDAYVTKAAYCCQEILSNTNNDDWALRYFAAQTYVDLYAKTNDTSYLQKAYDVTLNNVNQLLTEQQTLNVAYLADVVEQKAAAGETADEKKAREQYNTLLRETRKTELAPVSEPLLLNCELLFSLADTLGISDFERSRIDRILHTNGSALFLIEPLDQRFCFSNAEAGVDSDQIDITFSGNEITIPVKYVSTDASICVTVVKNGDTKVYEDWKISKVTRKENGNIDSFWATFSCAAATYFDSSTVTICITPKKGVDTDAYTFHYTTERSGVAGIKIGFLPIIFKRVAEE